MRQSYSYDQQYQVPMEFSTKKSSKSKPKLKTPISYLKRSCPFNNQAALVCANPLCDQPGLLCLQPNCLCIKQDNGHQNNKNINLRYEQQKQKIYKVQLKHENCKIIHLQTLVQKIEQKRKKTNIHPIIQQHIEKIQQSLSELIQELSLYRDALEIYIQNYGLSQQEYKLIQMLKSGQDQHINGKLVSLVKQKIYQAKIDLPELIMQHQKQFSRFKKDIQNKMGLCFSWFKHFCSSPQQMKNLGKQKEIVKYVKQNKWEQIITWIQSGKRAIDVTQLDLANRKISKIPKQIGLFKSLTKINLFNNQIVHMQFFNHLKNLTSLDLKKNRIQKIENINLLPNLTKLYLNDNAITQINNLPSSLISLGLDKNKIFKIENLSHLKNLQLLCLTSNNIQKLQNINIQQLISIKQIRLNKNPIQGRIKNKQYLQEDQLNILQQLNKQEVKLDVFKK